MEIKDWLWFGLTLGGVFISVIGLYIRLLLKVNNLGMEILVLKKDFHIHETQNEKTFDKLEKRFEGFDKKLDVNTSKLDELKLILIQNNTK